MAILPIHAYGFAATFRLNDLVTVFAGAEVIRDSDKDRIVARWPQVAGPTPLAILFDFGAAVFFALPRADCDRWVDKLLARLSPEPHPPLTEDFLLEERPGARLEVQFDRVIVPEATLPVCDLLAILLAQSTVIDYYDEDVDEILARTDKITTRLTRTGRLPGRVSSLARFIGACMTTRNDVIASLALFDKPESTWENPELDLLYRGLRTELEIDDRFRALEMRLRMIQDNLVLFIEVMQNRSAWRLELTIVLLIVFEIVLSLWTLATGGTH